MDKKTIRWIVSFAALTVVCIVGSFVRSHYDSAAVLQSQGYVPVRAEDTDTLKDTIEAESSRAEKVFTVNINTATKEELCEVSGIGEKTALAIIKFREDYGGFKNIEEVKLVDGIGDKTYQQISKYLTTR